VTPQILHVVADASHAELAEIGQILSNLGRVQAELLCEPLRRDRLHPGEVELGQAAQVDRQPVGGELGDLFRQRPRFVRRFHKTRSIVADRLRAVNGTPEVLK